MALFVIALFARLPAQAIPRCRSRSNSATCRAADNVRQSGFIVPPEYIKNGIVGDINIGGGVPTIVRIGNGLESRARLLMVQHPAQRFTKRRIPMRRSRRLPRLSEVGPLLLTSRAVA